ncbi:HD-GYP domain-containing protein [Bacillus sp. 31A1R]|uniref:HD-GYP domain-containing protein n=1 Tax=Robertmurraya mangrovi TaxID=3098077 RepID=A0ABU5IWW6_9BACI|nr:HD-GYP domain-containing protein [Bacillus sp. 31A1R]MDZ5471639.1 HD-GYP domain-containing protein [Bacillus sp. 31A1R]
MRVKVKELQEGCIISEDIFSRTNRPIIAKRSILTKDLLEILEVFLINDVVVEKTLVNGSPFIPAEIIEDETKGNQTINQSDELTFIDLFLQATKDYKREFKSWQSGLPVDISKIRALILPLIERVESSPAEIFNLHHFSNEEEYLYQHSIAVGLISGFIGRKLNYNKGDIVQLSLAGCLSDCGMSKIPERVLDKRTALASEEFEEVKRHSTYSYRMIQNSPLVRDSVKISIFQHHERLDGSGYPMGEKGPKIHPFAKIIALADTFHAMTSERHYRKKQSPFKVLEMITQDNFGKFDITAINALQSGIMNFSIGSKVKLSNGQIGEILFIEDKSPTRPLVKIIETEVIIHLEKQRQLFIEEIM